MLHSGFTRRLLAASACFTSLVAHAATGFNLSADYAQNLWPAGHRDGGNSDYVPVVMARSSQVARHLLQGHPLFWPPVTGINGQLYVTTGKGPGYSHLHAFDSNGELLWQAPPQQSLADLDSGAIINAPAVDADGDIYVGDSDQLWAFHADGGSKWVVELADFGARGHFVTAVLAKGNLVGGITTDGKVMFFDRASGALARPVLDLPGGDGPEAGDEPFDGLWQNLMDPAIKTRMYNLIQGWEMEVANTPAVHPESGRLYITGYGTDLGTGSGTGLLYGIDILDERIAIAFQTPMGKGSGTSPAISHDGRRVYALDEHGSMVAVDAESGAKLWTSTERGGSAASPSVGPDETIYSPDKNVLLALHPDGSLRFRYSYNHYCADEIDELGGLWRWLFSPPTAFIDSIVTVDANGAAWMNIVCGYTLRWLPGGNERTRTPIPIKSTLLAVSLEDGRPLNLPLTLPETSEGFITPVSNGNQFVSLSGALTSIFYHSFNWLLPQRFKVKQEPVAGLLMLEPVDRLSLAQEQLDWLAERIGAARQALPAQPDVAIRLLTATTAQFFSSHDTIAAVKLPAEHLREATVLVAEALYLLNQEVADKAQRHLDEAEERLHAQRELLRTTQKRLRHATDR